MFNLDLRTFAPCNRMFFWWWALRAFNNFKTPRYHKNETVHNHLTDLSGIHKKIKQGEESMLLNKLTMVRSETFEKIGPGWQ
jgi:hypothetical protein